MLTKLATLSTWGQIWGNHIASCRDSNQTTEARRAKISEAKLRSWLNGGSPTVDYVIANRNRIPAQVKADLINALADGEFTVVPIEREEVSGLDPVMQAIALHGPVNEYVREIVSAYDDGVVTPDEESRITARYFTVRSSIQTTYVSVVIHRVRRIAGRIWRRA